MTDFRGLPVVPAGDPPPAPSAPLHNGASGTDRRGLPGFPAAARNPVGHLARLLPHHHHARAQHSAPSSPEYRPQRRADSPPATSSERPDSQLHRGSAADTGQPEDRGRSRSGRSTDPPRPVPRPQVRGDGGRVPQSPATTSRTRAPRTGCRFSCRPPPIAGSTYRVARPARPEYRVLSSSPSAVHRVRSQRYSSGLPSTVVDHGPRFRVPPCDGRWLVGIYARGPIGHPNEDPVGSS